MYSCFSLEVNLKPGKVPDLFKPNVPDVARTLVTAFQQLWPELAMSKDPWKGFTGVVQGFKRFCDFKRAFRGYVGMIYRVSG